MTASNTDTRDPAEIEREIRRTQTDMSRTVDQIEGQLTPKSIMNALLDKADQNGVDARYLMDGARRNPLALGMIAIGGIWLVSDSDARPSALKPSGMGSSKGSDTSNDFHPSYVEHMSRCERMADEDDLVYRRRRDLHRANYLMVEQRHDEDESSFRDRLDKATESLRQRRDSMMHRAHDMGSNARGGASNMTSNLTSKAGSMYRENPLVGGIIAALAGALAGSAAPVTRTEEEQFGKMGAQALDAGKSKAQDLGEKAKEKKDEMVDKADSKMSDNSSSGGGSSTTTSGTTRTQLDRV